MNLVLKRFKEFCIEQRIALLPDDLKFIEKRLNKLPDDRHRIVLQGYYREWLIGMDSRGSPHLAQSKGRKNANAWLMENS